MTYFVYWEGKKPRNKHERWLDKIWNSNGKRYKVPRFKCRFCGKIIKGSSYSVVDGCHSCLKCDNYYKT